jgi:hypothetical protein
MFVDHSWNGDYHSNCQINVRTSLNDESIEKELTKMKCYKCKHCRYRGTRYYCSKDRKWISSENYYTMKTIACSENLKKDELVGDYVLLKLS